MKLGRKYRLTIEQEGGNEVIVIEPPFTIQFSIDRSVSSSMNTLNLVVYNLSEKTRNFLYQDWFQTNIQRRVILEAGYDDLSIVFSGTIRTASSARQGSNIITVINAFDGGFATQNAMTFKTLRPGITLKELLKELYGDLPNINQGATGADDQDFKRGVLLNGNTFELLKKYSNNQVYIDLETVNVLKNNQVIEGDIDFISADTGLLETPRREDNYLTITTLFEPRILMGQVVEIESSVMPIYNGQYKVIGVTHQGVISEAVGGQCQSRFSLLSANAYFGKFEKVKKE